MVNTPLFFPSLLLLLLWSKLLLRQWLRLLWLPPLSYFGSSREGTAKFLQQKLLVLKKVGLYPSLPFFSWEHFHNDDSVVSNFLFFCAKKKKKKFSLSPSRRPIHPPLSKMRLRCCSPQISLWDMRTAMAAQTLSGHTTPCNCAVFDNSVRERKKEKVVKIGGVEKWEFGDHKRKFKRLWKIGAAEEILSAFLFYHPIWKMAPWLLCRSFGAAAAIFFSKMRQFFISLGEKEML